jgi:hypothetical protein
VRRRAPVELPTDMQAGYLGVHRNRAVTLVCRHGVPDEFAARYPPLHGCESDNRQTAGVSAMAAPPSVCCIAL